jgi:hypothetical protein
MFTRAPMVVARNALAMSLQAALNLISPTHMRTEGRAPVWGSEFTAQVAALKGGIQKKSLLHRGFDFSESTPAKCIFDVEIETLRVDIFSHVKKIKTMPGVVEEVLIERLRTAFKT